jgi:hypothetical protein
MMEEMPTETAAMLAPPCRTLVILR